MSKLNILEMANERGLPLPAIQEGGSVEKLDVPLIEAQIAKNNKRFKVINTIAHYFKPSKNPNS